MPEVQVAIGLRRKARDNLRDSARGQVILNNVAKEVAGGGWVCGGRRREEAGHGVKLSGSKIILTCYRLIPRLK